MVSGRDLRGSGKRDFTRCRLHHGNRSPLRGFCNAGADLRRALRAVINAQWERFLSNLEAIGIPRGGAKNWTLWPAVAIRVKATALFNQTPGPGTGAPIA